MYERFYLHYDSMFFKPVFAQMHVTYVFLSIFHTERAVMPVRPAFYFCTSFIILRFSCAYLSNNYECKQYGGILYSNIKEMEKE